MLSTLSEKVLKRGRKQREEGRGYSKTGAQQSGAKVQMGHSPLSPSSTARCTGRSLALTGRPPLSQRLSGKGLPARMMQGRDTGCLSSTRTVEALLAIWGAAVGRGHSVGGSRFLWVGTEALPSPPQGPAQEAGLQVPL